MARLPRGSRLIARRYLRCQDECRVAFPKKSGEWCDREFDCGIFLDVINRLAEEQGIAGLGSSDGQHRRIARTDLRAGIAHLRHALREFAASNCGRALPPIVAARERLAQAASEADAAGDRRARRAVARVQAAAMGLSVEFGRRCVQKESGSRRT